MIVSIIYPPDLTVTGLPEAFDSDGLPTEGTVIVLEAPNHIVYAEIIEATLIVPRTETGISPAVGRIRIAPLDGDYLR